ncbi:unnamed protein product, partial [marine sediment metagenome]
MLEEDWIIKWKIVIDKISHLIERDGKEMVILNVKAQIDSKRQFEQYQKTCESVKDRFEAVVTTSLPGEERIFWPNKDVQFYIKEGVEKIQSTGNFEIIQKI